MKGKPLVQIFIILGITVFFGHIGGFCSDGQQPVVIKVEPPNWWADHSMNPVRLLIRGKNFANARIKSSHESVQVERIRVNESGTYLFADVRIADRAQPGEYPLIVSTNDGNAQVPFEISPPLSRDGRFQGFTSDDVIYLLMPDRFANGDLSNDNPDISNGLLNRRKNRYYHGGDLSGVIDHLPYLKDLGVTAIWMNPVYDNVNHLNEWETYNNEAITDYHGYGAVDFYAVEEHFGDVALLRELVDRSHELGIKVIQDQVANHTGPYHPWVSDPPTPTWYNGTQADHLDNVWQTWTLVDPYATPETQKATLEGWFINILPDLNQGDEETALYLIQNTLWWIGMTGIDGIRQDTLPYVHRRFWRDWMAAIKQEYPRFKVVGEMWDGSAPKVAFFQGGVERFDGIDSGIDALFDFPLYYPLRRAFAEGKSVRELAIALSQDPLYTDPDMLVTFVSLHDVSRFMHETNATVDGLKLAFTFIMTARGIPLIYYGDEIAMRGGGDPDNRRDFPGGWPDDPRDAFTHDGRSAAEQEVFEHMRRLGRLRGKLVPLRRGRTMNLLVHEQQYIYARVDRGSVVIVALNNGPERVDIDCPVNALGFSDGMVLVDCLEGHPNIRVKDKRIHLNLNPRSGSVFTIETE